MKRKWQNQIVELWREYSWSALGVLALLALTLGYVGFEQQSAARQIGREPADNLYLALLLFSLNPVEGPHVGPFLEVARFVAIVVASIAIFKTLKIIFDEQYQALKLNRVKNHIVICGLGEKGLLLAQSFRKFKLPVVVVERDESNPSLSALHEMRALLCQGDASSAAILKKARVQHARHVIAVCGDDKANIDIAAQTLDLLKLKDKPRLTPLSCVVHLVDDKLRDLLQDSVTAVGCRLKFFNVYDSGARTLLVQHPVALHAEKPHVMVIGLGLMGRNLLECALADWQKVYGQDHKLRVTAVDAQASEKMKTIFHLCDDCSADCCELETHDMSFDEAAFERSPWLYDASGERRDVMPTVIYVCLEQDSQTHTTALRLHRELKKLHALDTRIVMCLKTESGLASFQQFESLEFFYSLQGSCNADLPHGGIFEVLARAIYEHYLRSQLRQTNGNPHNRKPLVTWDDWEKVDDATKRANHSAAAYLAVKLRAIGCTFEPQDDSDQDAKFALTSDELDTLACREHERWRAEKERAGWTYGEARDSVKKCNPLLVPWLDLDSKHQDESIARERDVPEILALAGYRIRRTNQKH